MQGVSVLLVGSLGLSAAYSLLSAWAVRAWFSQEPAGISALQPAGVGKNASASLPAGERFEPITFFRPLKGCVPGLEEMLRTFLGALEAGDQVVFGVDAGSPEEALCEQCRAAFPENEVAIVRCTPGRAANPKISKLIQMEAHARHEHWLLSDTEALLSREFLRAFREEWARDSPAALTAGYRFVGIKTLAQGWDAVGALVGLWPGLALVRQFGRVNFTLGACTLFRREALEALGGWSAFGEFLGEDQQLGAALVAQGRQVALSAEVVSLGSEPLSWTAYWRHQRRVAVTYRVAQPAGFAGMLLTQGLSLSLGLFVFTGLSPSLAGLWVGTFLVRWWSAALVARRLQFRLPGLGWCVLGASLVETVCWALAWVWPRVWWAGRWWQISRGGKLRPIAP